MDEPASDRDDANAKLRRAIAAFPATGFAIVDGAVFEDLPALLRREGLFARSLFLDQADRDIEAAGPWLVDLDQAPDATDRIFALIGDEPAAVFWCSAAGNAAMYRHLRTLNLARIPAWAAAGGETAPTDGSSTGNASVTFRHWDPRVLSALLPVLDAGQFRRIVGSASEIAFRADEYGGLKRVVPDLDWPPAPSGLLTIRADQFEVLNRRRIGAAPERALRFLRRRATAQVAHLGDAELRAAVSRHAAEAAAFGAHDERSLFLWSFMQTTSPHDLGRDQFVQAFLRDRRRGKTPGERMETLFDLRTEMLRRRHG